MSSGAEKVEEAFEMPHSWTPKRRLATLLALTSFSIALAATQAAVITVRIVSPADGTTVEPGQILEVTVDAQPLDQVPGVAVLSPLTSDFKTTPPFVFSLQIPPDAPLGPQPLTAFVGLGKDKFVDSSITLRVETVTPVIGLHALAAQGVIPVAILSTADFDATTVDALSVRFGPGKAIEAHQQGHPEDVNADGKTDLVLHFNTQDTGIQCGQTSATLTGFTTLGQRISGSDAIRPIGPGCP